MKKVLFVLAFVFAFVGNAEAAGGEKNISYYIDETAVEQDYEFTAEPGQEITIDLMLGDMTVGIWAGGLRFDKEKLEVLSIVGADEEYPDYYFANIKNSDMKQLTTVASTTEESNTYGTVGFCWIIYSDNSFTKSKLATIRLRVRQGAAGTAEFSIYEKSDGKDGYVGDYLDKCKMTIKKSDQKTTVTPVVTPVVTPASNPTVTEKASTPTKKPEITENIDPTPVENNDPGTGNDPVVSITPELTGSTDPETTETVTPAEGDISAEPTGEANISEALDPTLTIDPTKIADNEDEGSDKEKSGSKQSPENIKNTPIPDQVKEKADSEKKKEETKTVIIIIVCAIIAVASGMAAKYVGRKDKEKNETKENIDETEVENDLGEDKTE